MSGHKDYTRIVVQRYGDWYNHNEPVVKLLQKQMADRGVHITETEAWCFFAWCLSTVIDTVSDAFPDNLAGIRQQLAPALHQRFREEKLGRWEPPVGLRFDSPQAFAATQTAPAVEQVGDYRSSHGYI